MSEAVDDLSGLTRRVRLADSRLYLVCESLPGGSDPGTLLEAALSGGVDVVQLRDKQADDSALLEAAKIFRKVTSRHGALFFLNDRPDLAVAAQADGVHIGQGDGSIRSARRTVGPNMLIGVSTHAEREIAAASKCADVDYIAVGPVFATPTKPGVPPVGTELVAIGSRITDLPIFVIGGIDESNAATVVAAGARRVAAVRAIRDADDPEEAARRLRMSVSQAAER